MAEETDENGWKVGYLYRDREHIEGEHPVERDDVSWHHIWSRDTVAITPEGRRELRAKN